MKPFDAVLPAPAQSKPIVEVEGFSAWYGQHLALKEIGLEIFPHEILGVIGPAGFGVDGVGGRMQHGRLARSLVSFPVPAGRGACGKIALGRPPTSAVLGAGEAVSQFDAGSRLRAAHRGHEHDGPTLPFPRWLLRVEQVRAIW